MAPIKARFTVLLLLLLVLLPCESVVMLVVLLPGVLCTLLRTAAAGSGGGRGTDKEFPQPTALSTHVGVVPGCTHSVHAPAVAAARPAALHAALCAISLGSPLTSGHALAPLSNTSSGANRITVEVTSLWGGGRILPARGIVTRFYYKAIDTGDRYSSLAEVTRSSVSPDSSSSKLCEASCV
jgi:hypothetical protein